MKRASLSCLRKAYVSIRRDAGMKKSASVALASASWVICVTLFGLVAIGGPVKAQSTISPYLKDVVSHFAPIVIGETENAQLKPQSADQLLPVDFDGTSDGKDNARNGDAGAVVPAMAKSTVYYSIVESGTTSDKGYFFINYYFYHPRDMGSSVNLFGLGYGASNHEHDLEGVAFLVKKGFYSPYGSLIAAYSQAHGALIPYVVQSGISPGAAGHPSVGFVQFWYDAATQVSRPVVAIRSRKHGTYMAQDCTDPVNGQDNPGGHSFGMVVNSPQTGYYTSCIHDDSKAITYVPVPLNTQPSSGISADYLGNSVRQGTYRYQLTELVTSPIWQLRTTYDLLFTSLNTVYMAGGQIGFGYFNPSDVFAMQQSGHGANPPWSWRGGSGDSFASFYWYSFGMENTLATSSKINWPLAPANGQLLTDPNAEGVLRFPTLAEITQPYRYNPYVSSPPVCCSIYPVSGSISGYTLIVINQTKTWTGIAGGGTPPYTYRWSGLLTGTGQAITGSPRASGTLILNIADAAGAGTTVSTQITVNDPDHCTGTKC